MHPDYESYEEELLRIKSLGLKGIKLHPQYQNTFIDDIKYQKIIDKAFELGLIVIIHAGIDIGIPGDVCATPQRILNLYNNLNHKGIFVLAHMGSWLMWDEVYEKILGKDFYIDTAFSLNEAKQNNEIINLLKEENIKKFISKHGSNKILFGTDSPWANQKEYLDYMNNLNIDKDDLNNILGLNAKIILNL
jgi:predicted TIM-barrel fold metal-dependent hydrolase